MNLASHIGALYASHFRPRWRGKIADWARANIILSPKESGDFPGAYDPGLNPLPTILFDVYQSGDYDKAVFKKSSQSGVTLVVLVFICWYIIHVRKNFLYTINILTEMRRVSKERLLPMIRGCGGMAREMSDNRDDLTTLTLSLKHCTGYLGTANSPELQKSVGLAINDECDVYKDGGRAVHRTAERGKRQTQFFHILLSKPENFEDTINREYLQGSRHKCFVPCPHCGEMQTIEEEQLRADHCKDLLGAYDLERVANETYLECINTECPGDPGNDEPPRHIAERHKPRMIELREWRATNLGEDEWKPTPRVFSCEISDGYSSFPKTTWGALMVKRIQARGNPERERDVQCGNWAKPWEEEISQVDLNDISKMTKGYRRGQCPVRPDIVLMAADVQGVGQSVRKDARKWVKTGHLLDGTVYVIDWGECLTFEELLVEADKPVEVLDWGDTPEDERTPPVVYKGFIDEGDGHAQSAVRDFIVSTLIGQGPAGLDYRFYSCFGRGGLQTQSWRDAYALMGSAKSPTIHNGLPISVYKLNDDFFKHQLYIGRFTAFAKARQIAARNANKPEVEREKIDEYPGTWFPVEVVHEEEFRSELCQEARVWDEKKQKWLWLDPKKANDFGDALKYCLAMFYILRPILENAAQQRRMLEAAQAIGESAAAEPPTG